jgi:hypothetical protein
MLCISSMASRRAVIGVDDHNDAVECSRRLLFCSLVCAPSSLRHDGPIGGRGGPGFSTFGGPSSVIWAGDGQLRHGHTADAELWVEDAIGGRWRGLEKGIPLCSPRRDLGIQLPLHPHSSHLLPVPLQTSEPSCCSEKRSR